MRSLLALIPLLIPLLAAVLAVTPALADVTAGRVLLKLEKAPATDVEAAEQLATLAHGKDVGLVLERRSVYGWVVARVDATDTKRTEEAMALLRNDAGVIAADVIRTQVPHRLPNDEFIDDLWGFALIDAETAWDKTIGLSSQRIGVVDSGINRDHFDLFAHDVRGFDFISDADLAADGDGRDSEYDDVATAGGFHGSHVSGTISAEADDFFGVPGLNWNAGLVTARALADVGSTLDIVEASAWLAGADVPGVPAIGADRVSVINLSLGSVGACSPLEEDFYSAIIASGVTVVAAAGNEGNDVPTGSPANCPGVIAVGAVGRSGLLASYSNFDDRIDVVAPGGDAFSANDPFESILSVDGSNDSGHVAIDGTSMAAPHVTGIVSLMQAVNPRLSPRQIQSILVTSPFTCADDSCGNKAFLDAADALAKAETTEGELGDGADGGAGGGECPPNSQLTSDGQACTCNAGFVVNTSETGCVPADGDDNANDDANDGDANDDCPPNSELSNDGELCICDVGFVVNEDETGCASADGDGNDDDDDDGRDEDSDDDDFRGSAFSGCSSTPLPSSLCALAALLLLARRRAHARARRSNIVKAMGSIAVVVACLVSTGCAHTVRIESTPGAEIFVNGKSVGTAPAMYIIGSSR